MWRTHCGPSGDTFRVFRWDVWSLVLHQDAQSKLADRRGPRTQSQTARPPCLLVPRAREMRKMATEAGNQAVAVGNLTTGVDQSSVCLQALLARSPSLVGCQ